MTCPPSDSSLNVDLRHVMTALSDALDLVGVNDMGHGKRVAIMAAAIAHECGMPAAQTSFMFDVGIMHDIGVSSTRVHRQLVAEFAWADSQAHCEVGYQLLNDFAPLARMALPVRYHHTPWETLRTMAIDPQVALQANIVHLADRVDALCSPFRGRDPVLMFSDTVREQVAKRRGADFAPELVDVFLRISQAESFWLQLDDRGIHAAMARRLEELAPYRASVAELRQLARIFSRIVDTKSQFTSEHSQGVARLAHFLGRRMGVSAANCDKMEIAGLLHDVGKLRVPDEILEKAGPLDARESAIMRTHSYETYLILQTIRGFEEITQWAAWHHERPHGDGYPFHLDGTSLPLEARIMRVADTFQALVQDRPYRSGMDMDTARAIVLEMKTEKQLDEEVVAALCGDLPGALAAALGERVGMLAPSHNRVCA